MQVDRTRAYRVRAVAEMLDISLSTVYRAIESGELDVLRFGSTVRIPGAALAVWLDQRGQAGYTAYVTGTIRPAADDAAATDAVVGGER
ncbi:hypothetical protein Ae406Ps2_4242 [Pseudonocardia sp. Ae406_Ps2]|uniref:helix-turn-helix domain-containing protein n=1 Tax=unclassified Pseudonocardia TaxID=2619320 RepID=UPI00094B0728|nr:MULTISPECIES: helix-turn-helix domain-containing protein [unclassified Pseudonocardia]OLL98048.1 hypothetical protein Ae331Ps2_1715c [Pseudonocardia sp. Ae331_Ps2]OLM04242.1 hypothetical protein Ae406Ps2_4242 [Pseudonocardia sp. Ae406_Ps2]OLM10931.1 hypothetical protein Ae505Ps2_1054 [Pseudonocardia sp. Ae505_Ps2]OLM25798.1 hypothetical protein Ae706Ps2_4231 [Pseudonocardia sp. Ae706_Ps2]OLM25802.1 hypothetical protein Ae706Ps2_4235 [Pseudonocardia sp. Ae706_Ps2]